MHGDAGGWLWFVIDVIFVAVLLAALIYGTFMWRTRRKRPALQSATEQATRSLYETEEEPSRKTRA
jgi:uncharacterized membrane protein